MHICRELEWLRQNWRDCTQSWSSRNVQLQKGLMRAIIFGRVSTDEQAGEIMKLPTEPYLLQSRRWPQSGRHILAHFDSESIVVYQAYQPAIGRYAAQHQRFGGEFSFARMSWIKTNFLWMMYR